MTRKLEAFAIGCCAGIAIGVIAGLLLAPRSGSETRRRLAVQARKAAAVAREVADRAEVTAEVLGGRVDHYLGREQEVAWRKVREIREGVDRYTQAQAL
jgi:gas vesicle protein